MPNMFGGPQDHPAYSGRKLNANENLVGNDLYTKSGNMIIRTTLSGGEDRFTLDDTQLPLAVRRHFVVIDTCFEPARTVPVTTACKHGKKDCKICGTTSRRDVVHTTKRGKGVVGQIKRQR